MVGPEYYDLVQKMYTKTDENDHNSSLLGSIAEIEYRLNGSKSESFLSASSDKPPSKSPKIIIEPADDSS